MVKPKFEREYEEVNNRLSCIEMKIDSLAKCQAISAESEIKTMAEGDTKQAEPNKWSEKLKPLVDSLKNTGK